MKLLYILINVGLVLLLSFPIIAGIESPSKILDGGNASGWDKSSWKVQVDGVMGGRSSGSLSFIDDDETMFFSGNIVTRGGGFSSVRRFFDETIDMSSYAGIVVEVEPLNFDLPNISSPIGLHLQLHDTRSYWAFSAAFAIPVADDGNSTSNIFIPMDQFSRGSRMGWQCRWCSLDTTSIIGMDIYVLFQEGSFETRFKSITAVAEMQEYESPPVNFTSSDDILELLESTISSGSSLYDKGYRELCNSIYWSTINTIIAGSSTTALKHVACAGLNRAAIIAQKQQTTRNKHINIAWALRYTMDTMIADLLGVNRNMEHEWLPTMEDIQAAIIDNDQDLTYCVGTTSMIW